MGDRRHGPGGDDCGRRARHGGSCRPVVGEGDDGEGDGRDGDDAVGGEPPASAPSAVVGGDSRRIAEGPGGGCGEAHDMSLRAGTDGGALTSRTIHLAVRTVIASATLRPDCDRTWSAWRRTVREGEVTDVVPGARTPRGPGRRAPRAHRRPPAAAVARRPAGRGRTVRRDRSPDRGPVARRIGPGCRGAHRADLRAPPARLARRRLDRHAWHGISLRCLGRRRRRHPLRGSPRGSGRRRPLPLPSSCTTGPCRCGAGRRSATWPTSGGRSPPRPGSTSCASPCARTRRRLSS